jgi:hypothetical protein
MSEKEHQRLVTSAQHNQVVFCDPVGAAQIGAWLHMLHMIVFPTYDHLLTHTTVILSFGCNSIVAV